MFCLLAELVNGRNRHHTYMARVKGECAAFPFATLRMLMDKYGLAYA